MFSRAASPERHGWCLLAEWVGLLLCLVCGNLQEPILYKITTILAGILNTHVAFLFTSTLFRQVAFLSGGGRNDNNIDNTTETPNNNNATATRAAQLQQQRAKKRAEELRRRQEEQQKRLYQYNEIQARKWSNVFVRMEDAEQQNNDDQNENDKDGNTSTTTKKNKNSSPYGPRKTANSIPTPPPLEGYRFVSLGPCLSLPYTIVGIITIVLSTLLCLESYQQASYNSQFFVWISVSRWTSTLDWFRTFFLLSYGLLMTMFLFYNLPNLQYYILNKQQFVYQIQRLQYYWGWNNKNRDSSPTSSNNNHEEDPNNISTIEMQPPRRSKKSSFSVSSKQQLLEQEPSHGPETHPTAQTENDDGNHHADEQDDPSHASYSPPSSVPPANNPEPLSTTTTLDSPTPPKTTTTTTTTLNSPTRSPPQPPMRTSQEASWSTRIVAYIVGLISLVLIFLLARKWTRTVQEIRPAMNWSSGRGQDEQTGHLNSFQGDAWVTGYQLADVNDGDDQQQIWCPNANNNAQVQQGEEEEQTQVLLENAYDHKGDYIDVLVDVAWGGEWACPNQPDTYCEDTISTRVSCQVATHPLTTTQVDNDDNNDGGDDQYQNNDDGNGNGNNNNNNDEFPTVYDYLNFRFQDSNNNNNNDDGNNDDGNNNNVDFSYDPDQAPSSNEYDDGTTRTVSWNRQAEFVVANCQNCQARSVWYVQDHFPAVAQILHGLFIGWGIFLACLIWVGILLPMAQQQQTQHTATQPALAWQTLL